MAGKGPTTGSPKCRWGRVRSLGTTSTKRLLPGERLLSRHRGGGSGMVPRSPRHKLLKSSRLRLGGAEFLHYRAYRFPEQPRLWDRCIQQELLLTYLSEVQPQMALPGHRNRHRASYGVCGVFSGSESQVSGSAQLFDSLFSQASPLVHFLKDVRLVGLKDGHRVEGHACLAGSDVGLPDESGSNPTRLGRKEGAGLPRRRQRGWKVGDQSFLYHRHGGVALLHRTNKVGEVSGRHVSEAGRKCLFPGSGDLMMQITKNGSFLRSGFEFEPLRNRSSSFEERDSRGSSGQSSASFSVVRESTSTSSE